MNALERIARGLLKPINPYVTVFLGLFTAAWGLWVLSPFWHVFTSAALFEDINFAPEWAWGTWSTICGLSIIYSLYRHHVKSLTYSLLFGAWHWGIVAIMLWMGDWTNTGGVTYTFICLYCAYAYLNIKCNYVKTGKPLSNELDG